VIFISHTEKDKPIVEPIATRLASVFGAENVFYDSWSIQPGDGIIDKMSEGLESSRFFFFFVSSNSLQSKMVSLEWQNALLRASKGNMRFIPVKLDACMMPGILLQSLYIDIYGKGLEVGIRQMIDVINGNNTFRPQTQTFENIRGKITMKSDSNCLIEFYAEYYLEPISRYGIVTDNDLGDINIVCLSDTMRNMGKMEAQQFNNGEIHNVLFESVSRGTAPNFPYRIELSTRSGGPIKIVSLLRAINEQYYNPIPFVVVAESNIP